MKKNYLLIILFAPLYAFSQFTLYSDFYIASNTELHITAPKTTFQTGSFITAHGPSGGLVSFASNSQWENADHNAHVDGNVYNPQSFQFPSGHNNILQQLAISQASGVDYLEIDYRQTAHNDLAPNAQVLKIHPQHYWSINNATGNAKVSLSWNAFSKLDVLLEERGLEALSIAGYKNGDWELLPSTLDSANTNSELVGNIISDNTINLSDYSALALALGLVVIDGGGGETDTEVLNVAEGISSNGDGVNDVWMIQNIEKYPQAQVYVYNRLGREVYRALNGYNNDWRGNFEGNADLLPSGPYFYTIDLDNDGKVDRQGWLYIQN
tara:strand:- start:63 stop:1037 length:975 start_codon:yes stop_codon:yes gene_type:complete